MSRIKLDLSKQSFHNKKVNQFDDRNIGIDIFENDEPYSIDGAYIVLNMVNADNQAITQTQGIAKKGNAIDIELMREATNKEGVLIMQLVIVKANKQRSTFEFSMQVNPSILNGADIGTSIIIDSIKLLNDKIVEATKLIEDNKNLIVTGGVATKEDINSVNAQLEHMVNLEGFETLNRKRKKQPLIVFWDDDSLFETRTKLKPLFTSKNVPLTVAVPMKQNQLTVEEMLDLQNNFGWEFTSHSYNHLELPTLTDEQLHYELRESKKWLNERGIKCDALAIPYGKFNDNVLTVARQYYRAIRYSEYGHNYQPYETALKMVQLIENKDFDNETGFYRNSLDFYKYHVDKCFEENTLLILMSHSYAYTDDEIPIISQLIDYVKTKGIQTVTISEALNLSGNLVETGLFFKYGAEKPHFAIGGDGSVDGTDIVGIKYGLESANDYFSLKKEKIGYVAFNRSEASANSMPESEAGVLTTYTIGTSRSYAYSYQEYRLLTSAKIYYRVRIDSQNWGQWISNSSPIKLDDTIDGNTLSNVFSVGTITYSKVSKSVATSTNLPEGLAGLLITNRIGTKGYEYQEYRVYGTNRVYTRYANEDNVTWSTWIELIHGIRYKDIAVSDFTVNANSFQNVEIVGVPITNSTPIAFSVYNASVNCIISHMISGGKLYIRAYNPTSTSVTVSGLRVNCIVY